MFQKSGVTVCPCHSHPSKKWNITFSGDVVCLPRLGNVSPLPVLSVLLSFLNVAYLIFPILLYQRGKNYMMCELNMVRIIPIVITFVKILKRIIDQQKYQCIRNSLSLSLSLFLSPPPSFPLILLPSFPLIIILQTVYSVCDYWNCSFSSSRREICPTKHTHTHEHEHVRMRTHTHTTHIHTHYTHKHFANHCSQEHNSRKPHLKAFIHSDEGPNELDLPFPPGLIEKSGGLQTEILEKVTET